MVAWVSPKWGLKRNYGGCDENIKRTGDSLVVVPYLLLVSLFVATDSRLIVPRGT